MSLPGFFSVTVGVWVHPWNSRNRLIWRDLRWVSWVLRRWNIRNWVAAWINGDDLPVLRVGNRDRLVQVVWRDGRSTGTSLVSVVAWNDWGVNIAEGVVSNIPAGVIDDLPRDVIKGDRLGEVKALLVVGRCLVTGTDVVNGLRTRLLQTVNVRSA